MKTTQDNKPKSERQQECSRMLKEGLKSPGVYEIMELYKNWQEQEKEVEKYQSLIKDPHWISLTNATKTS